LADSNYDSAPEYLTPATRQKAAGLRSRRQKLNVMRHEFLISLRAVNTAERELVEEVWLTWLGEELYRCDRAAHLLARMSNEEIEPRINDIAKLSEYCGDCRKVWGNVKEGFTALS
jgi:hypothetical protein